MRVVVRPVSEFLTVKFRECQPVNYSASMNGEVKELTCGEMARPWKGYFSACSKCDGFIVKVVDAPVTPEPYRALANAAHEEGGIGSTLARMDNIVVLLGVECLGGSPRLTAYLLLPEVTDSDIQVLRDILGGSSVTVHPAVSPVMYTSKESERIVRGLLWLW